MKQLYIIYDVRILILAGMYPIIWGMLKCKKAASYSKTVNGCVVLITTILALDCIAHRHVSQTGLRLNQDDGLVQLLHLINFYKHALEEKKTLLV